jgi:hypothetical protein
MTIIHCSENYRSGRVWVFLPRSFRLILASICLTLSLGALMPEVQAEPFGIVSLPGRVESDGTGLGHYWVVLYRSRAAEGHAFGPGWMRRDAVPLAAAVTRPSGRFVIRFRPPAAPGTVLYLAARRGPVALATVLGSIPSGQVTDAPLPRKVVINERTTVATGFAMAQFLKGRTLAGNAVGLRNAAAMVRNLVDVTSGRIADVLGSPPNGARTSTLAAFNSLANLLANCVARRPLCFAILHAARDERGRLPAETLHAMANIARNPWRHVGRIYRIASIRPPTYAPALARAPDAWTIALKFMGDGRLNGPGNFAIDAEGNGWVTVNYQPGSRDSDVCAGKTVYRFTPTGQLYPGSPYAGGGLDGAGFGIGIDPVGRIWIGNFGFEAPACTGTEEAATHDSVSVFDADGRPLSPETGFSAGGISWPQGTVSDRAGNIWVANCGNDSVTLIPDGDPARARNIAGDRLGLKKPFDVAIDGRGRAWVTGNGNDKVAVIGHRRIRTIQGTFDQPMGIAADRNGNMWVANSARIDVPCPDGARVTDPGPTGSITLIGADGQIARGAPFTGGGLSIPWGIAVDGNDQVWVANFGSLLDEGGSSLVRLSQFCGTDVARCPPGWRTGQPISPATGYTSDGLTRVTGLAVDPSGNVWLVNNWKLVPPPNNPGGDAILIFIGLAGPVRTPLIGLPERPES